MCINPDSNQTVTSSPASPARLSRRRVIEVLMGLGAESGTFLGKPVSQNPLLLDKALETIKALPGDDYVDLAEVVKALEGFRRDLLLSAEQLPVGSLSLGLPWLAQALARVSLLPVVAVKEEDEPLVFIPAVPVSRPAPEKCLPFDSLAEKPAKPQVSAKVELLPTVDGFVELFEKAMAYDAVCNYLGVRCNVIGEFSKLKQERNNLAKAVEALANA